MGTEEGSYLRRRDEEVPSMTIVPRQVDWAAQILGRELEIVRKEPDQCGFQVQPKRWARSGRCRG
ncbi:hypothetical protein GCM10022403_034540 [Streptomyces coacervatus]|uniref:Uncharacterized protein n=1 Tax=Streptomyces coacervatus TaxID=647381 RepID=A0ABP7HRA5_9ACTN